MTKDNSADKNSSLSGRTCLTEKELGFSPMLLEHIDTNNRDRLATIVDEFAKGFDFLKQYPRSVSFFGSSRTTQDDHDYKHARELAKRVVEELNYSVVTGGGPGIMEAANRGACDANGNSLGLTIKLPEEQATNDYVINYVDFHYFFVRKVMLSFAAEAYIFFPGGFGTMDELFELLTLIQTNKVKRVPIILVDHGHWKDFDRYVREGLLEWGAIDAEDTDIYTISDNDDEIIKIISESPVIKNVPTNED